MSGKRAFLDLLKQEGVEIMFGNPGTTELPIMHALKDHPDLTYVMAMQESLVVAMADGFSRASGKLVACNVHVAPGLGNAMGMLYDAQKAGSPILVTAGQHEQSFNATEPILWADLPTIARPLVKWSSEVHRLADLPRLVHRAAELERFRDACIGRDVHGDHGRKRQHLDQLHQRGRPHLRPIAGPKTVRRGRAARRVVAHTARTRAEPRLLCQAAGGRQDRQRRPRRAVPRPAPAHPASVFSPAGCAQPVFVYP